MNAQTAVLIQEPEAPALTIEAAAAPGVADHVAVGYLRAFITVLVVAHHTALAYHPFAPPPPASLTAQPRWWQAFPVVDSQRWAGSTLLVGAPDGRLARRWPAWVLSSLGAFGLAAIATILALAPHADQKVWGPVGGLAFALSCAASSFAFLALFVRFAARRGKPWDSLRANAYGIYLPHYAFVSWLQYLLLKAPLSGLAKASIALLGALALSWCATAALRRVPGVARVL